MSVNMSVNMSMNMSVNMSVNMSMNMTRDQLPESRHSQSKLDCPMPAIRPANSLANR